MPWKSHLTECQLLHYWSHTDFSSVLSVDWLIDMYYILLSIAVYSWFRSCTKPTAANFPHPTLRNIAVHPTTRSRMKSRLSWSTVSLARTAPAHILGRQAGSLVRGLRSTKKWIPSQLVYRPEPPEQGRVVWLTSQPPQTMLWSVEENHVIDWDNAKVVDREAERQTRWIKEAL